MLRAPRPPPALLAPNVRLPCMQWLAENSDLIEAAHERLSFGRLHDSLQYQLQLQQNLCVRGRKKY